MVIVKDVIVDSKTFRVAFDPDKMREKALEYKADFIENEELKDKESSDEELDETIEANAVIIKMLEDIAILENYTINDEGPLQEIVKALPKKKDGWLKKNCKYYYKTYEETSREEPEWFGDFIMCIKAKAHSAYDIDIDLVDDIFKW